MPTLVADRVNELGRQQAMPTTPTFGDHHANEIPDNLEELGAEADAQDDESYIDDSSSNHDDDELEGFLNDDDDDTDGSTSNSEHNELDQVVHEDTESKRAALRYLMFLKEKQCGWIKGARMC